MRLTPASRVGLQALGLLSLLVAPLAAQSLFIAEHKGKQMPVVRVWQSSAFVEVNGKQVVATGNRFGLLKVEEYLPYFVSVRDLEVSSHSLDLNNSAMNFELKLRTWLETPHWLKDVFIVLEFDTAAVGKQLFFYEVGELEPRKPKLLSLTARLISKLGESNYKMHIFTQSREVLHSGIDFMQREAALDRMIKARIATVKDAQPKIFVGLDPEYPKELLNTKTSGQVIVSLRIGTNGGVYDPVVKSASAPAFGEAALAAVRLWRFMPRVKEGLTVETLADVPIDFAPPEVTAKK